jgi:hypothetical protein
MTVNLDELFAELDRLTEEQIEASLAAGVWDEPKRQLAQHYLDQRKLKRVEAAAAEELNAVRSVVDDARAANFKATAAMIFAAGAMLAAMASAFVAFLALRN